MPDSHDMPELLSGDPISRRVCRRLTARRRALGLEPALLDLILGLREGTVQRLESGRGRIGPAYLLRLATLLDVRVDWFFDEAEPPEVPMAEAEARAGQPPSAEEARRFLTLYARLNDPNVRVQIREMVRALAMPTRA